MKRIHYNYYVIPSVELPSFCFQMFEAFKGSVQSSFAYRWLGSMIEKMSRLCSEMTVVPIHKFLGGAKFFMTYKKFFLRSHAKNPVSSPPKLKSIHVLNSTKA